VAETGGIATTAGSRDSTTTVVLSDGGAARASEIAPAAPGRRTRRAGVTAKAGAAKRETAAETPWKRNSAPASRVRSVTTHGPAPKHVAVTVMGAAMPRGKVRFAGVAEHAPSAPAAETVTTMSLAGA
jgi:hypothetical protein